MKANIRASIQSIVIKTSFPPLTYLYKLIYNLAVVIAVMSFKRVKGVRAIYLRRGMAKNEIVYGLSDIDLAVLIDDQDKNDMDVEFAKQRVISSYNKLSHFLPFFAKDDKELQVYSLSEFFRLYTDSHFFKYRFNEGKYTWRLLFGQDLVRDLPKLQDKELYLPATEELKEWWPKVAKELIPDFSGPLFEGKYLWYKAISEAAKVYMFVCHGEKIDKRRTALERIQEYLPPEQSEFIKKIETYPTELTSREDLPLDDLMNLFVTLSGQSFRKVEEEVDEGIKRGSAVLNSLSYRDLVLDERLSNLIEEVERMARQRLSPYLDFLALVPQIYLDIDPFYNSDIDSMYLVLVQKDRIPIKHLRELNLLLSQNFSQQTIEPCLTCGNIAVSLHPENWYQCIKSPRQCSLFFSLLSLPSLHLSVDPNQICDQYVNAALPPKIEEKTRKKIEAINDIISKNNIYKLRTLDFLRFVWGAARAKLLAHSLKSGQVHIPLTSKQILEMLSQFSSSDSNWLQALHSEYTKELRGEESEAARFYPESIEFLRRP